MVPGERMRFGCGVAPSPNLSEWDLVRVRTASLAAVMGGDRCCLFGCRCFCRPLAILEVEARPGGPRSL